MTFTQSPHEVTGAFVTLEDERYYVIGNVDKMAPFFINLVSDNDLWMFIASNGGLTAGRVSPDTALFPYVTVDKIFDSAPHTGSKTLIRVDGHREDWEPFNREHDGRYATRRNLYKSVLGDKLKFEEINDDLGLAFRFCWMTSESFGFVRQVEVENLGAAERELKIVDGLQNILPAGTPRFAQTNTSYLVDAYKLSELDEQTGLAMFTLFSGITDRAEPCESLRATTVFCLGLDKPLIMLSNEQLDRFRRDEALTQDSTRRGVRGAYLIGTTMRLAPKSSAGWQLVADVERTQPQVVSMIAALNDPDKLARDVERSVADGSETLARIMASGDAFQVAAEESVTAHHYANVLYNVLRGGIVDDQYKIKADNFRAHVGLFNRDVAARHATLLGELPDELDLAELFNRVVAADDGQLYRLALEYLPITFGRRHGDPSRPWNQFAIRLKDARGNRLLTYQGNWRDIFQNWEALLLSYPQFIENVIAKFVNASTADGYNPYRITNEGIDWEVEDPEDPWSYIGYWGDHQIIYLQKLLELSLNFHPERLGEFLHQPLYSYANVPYRIKPFAALLKNAKSTVEYDDELAERIDRCVAERGADGKLLLDGDGQVLQVTLLEKLLVSLLAKLGNFVIDGGVWLNTQRPEWNDANNALVGSGLSMVTLYYMRRYIRFLQQLLAHGQPDTVSLSAGVARWLGDTTDALVETRKHLGGGPLDARRRFASLTALGEAASRYREALYERESPGEMMLQPLSGITALLDAALAAIDHSIVHNRREDGMYHAYNLLELEPDAVKIDTLYPMLEGQVAALSCGAIDPGEAVTMLETLFASDLFRADQHSFLLYPDREIPSFLDKNRVPAAQVKAIGLLREMLARDDRRIIERDVAGTCRFNASLANVGALEESLNALEAEYGDALCAAREPLRALYEQVFNHRAFTGRSGGMFAFEGLGSIYWHMVSKLLLAAQENFFVARDRDAGATDCARLADLYYRIREGIGFNKTPAEYGAFPMDPYSHTPTHAGAQQPGMTGQVKEEMLTRFGELGVRVSAGSVTFDPALLREREFVDAPKPLRFVDVDGRWQTVDVGPRSLAFTWCQVPVVYRLDDAAEPSVTLHFDDGANKRIPGSSIAADDARTWFARSGRIRRVDIVVTRRQLCGS